MQRTKEFIAGTCDWVITVGIGLVGLISLWALGGWPWHGSALQFLGWLLGFLGIVQGIWWVTTTERPRKVRKLSFIFLPLLAYMVIQCLTRGASWFAWAGFWPWLATFGIWILLLHNVRTRLRMGVLGAILLVGIFMPSLLAFYQFYQEPDLLILERNTLDMYRWRGSGTLANPEWMAALALLAFPCLSVMALMRRLPGVARLASASMAILVALAILVSGSISAFWLLIVAFLVLPWASFPERRKQFRLLFRTLLCVALACLLAWLISKPLWDSIVRVAKFEEVSPITAVGNQNAVESKFENKAPFLFGYGPGKEIWANLSLGSPTQPANYSLANLWRRSPFYDAYGVIGCILLAGPLFFILWLGFRRWLSEPWVHMSKDDRERLVNLEAESKAEGSKNAARSFQRHLRSRGQQGPAPLAKVLLPALGLGLIFGCLQTWFSGALSLPTVLFHLAIVAGLLAKTIDWESIELPRHKHNSPVGLAIICILFGIIWLTSQRNYLPTRAYFTAREQLDALMADRSQLRYSPVLGNDSLFAYQTVLNLDENHLLARAELAALYLWIAQNSTNISLQDASSNARALLEPYTSEGSWPYFRALYGMALAADGADFDLVWKYIDDAAQSALTEPALQDLRKSANSVRESSLADRRSADFFAFSRIPIPANVISAGIGRPHDKERFKNKDERY